MTATEGNATMKWERICRCVPMYWLAGIYVNQAGWRKRAAFRVYIWFETRRVHESILNGYRERGYDV